MMLTKGSRARFVLTTAALAFIGTVLERPKATTAPLTDFVFLFLVLTAIRIAGRFVARRLRQRRSP
jgi:hypothetical protein